MKHDPILAADEAEFQAAAMALNATTNKSELVSVWNLDCDHFQGRARERLQQVYADKVAHFAPMGRAG